MIKYSICINIVSQNFIKFYILKLVKKNSNKKIKIFFYFKNDFNYTKLPLESRMGKGKGEIKNSFGYYKSGYILIEFKNFRLIDIITLKNYLNKKKFINLLINY